MSVLAVGLSISQAVCEVRCELTSSEPMPVVLRLSTGRATPRSASISPSVMKFSSANTRGDTLSVRSESGAAAPFGDGAFAGKATAPTALAGH